MVFLTIVLTIDSEDHIEECFNSILSQSYEDYELICISNHNNLNRYLENEKISIITSNKSSRADLKNEAIQKASGKYLSFIDSKTVIDSNYTLNKIHDEIEKEHLDLYSLNARFINNYDIYNDSIFTANQDILITDYEKLSGTDMNNLILKQNIIKRSFLIENNILFEDRPYGENMLFLAEITLKLGEYISVPLTYHCSYRKAFDITSEDIINCLNCYNNIIGLLDKNDDYETLHRIILGRLKKIRNMDMPEFSYEELKYLDMEVKSLLESIQLNGYESYRTKRALRYFKNRAYNRFTNFNVAISVIIPAYNVEKYLDECLISILNQTFTNFEIILVDDFSTDNTVKVIESYQKFDYRIRYVRKTSKSGAGGSRNIALSHARGKYVLFLDSDDWLDSTALEKLYNAAEEHETDLVMFKYINFDDTTEEYLRSDYLAVKVLDSYKNRVFNLDDVKEKLFEIAVVPGNKFQSRAYLESINAGFPEKYVHQDNPYFYQIFCDAEKIYFMDEYFYNRRLWNGSITHKFDKTPIGTIEIIEYMLIVFLENGLYESFKKKLLNRLIFKIKYRYNDVAPEYHKEYFIKAKNKLYKFIYEYGLYDDFKNNLNTDNMNYFNRIIHSNNFDEFIADAEKQTQ